VPRDFGIKAFTGIALYRGYGCSMPSILDSAAAVFFLHNHPSGDPVPSREDRDCTNRLVGASKILSIRVLDHIVFGESDYYSFADAG